MRATHKKGKQETKTKRKKGKFTTRGRKKFSRCWGRRSGSNKMMKPEHFWVQWGVVFYFISLLFPPSHPLPLIDGERASGWIWDVVGTRFRDGNWIWIGRSIDFKTNADAVPVSTLPFTPYWDIVTVNYMVDNSTSNKVLHTVQLTLDIRPFVMDCPSTSPHVLFRNWRDKKILFWFVSFNDIALLSTALAKYYRSSNLLSQSYISCRHGAKAGLDQHRNF